MSSAKAEDEDLLAASTNFFPDPLYPDNNPSSEAKIELGRQLFSEQRLSVNGSYSCASCHQPELHFTDGRSQAIGATGESHAFSTPTLYNVAYNASFGWQDTGQTGLEQQHLVPLTNNDPIEMGFDDRALQTLQTDAHYQQAFQQVFEQTSATGHESNGAKPISAVNPQEQVTLERIVQAIATYVRSIRAPMSAFDKYLLFDDREAMSSKAVGGMALFFSERLGCSGCHASFNFSGPSKHVVQQADPVFHITAVNGSTESFRAPTLRKVAETFPYMHDGSISDLAGVIHHYEQTDAERVPDFTLSPLEREQLIAFLRAI